MDGKESNSNKESRRSQSAARSDAEPSSGGDERRSRKLSSSNRAAMNQLEKDAVSKSRARSSARGTGEELNAVEERIAAKTKRNPSSRSMASSSTRSARSMASSNKNNQPPTEACEELERLEEHVTSKKKKKKKSGESSNSLSYTQQDLQKEDSYRSQGNNNPAMDNDSSNDKLGKPNEYDAPLSPGGGMKDMDRSGAPQESAPTMIAAHGMVNEPDVEYGTYGGGADGHGFDDTLAVAVAVSGEEEDAFIPAAIEYDPDSKPPIFRNRRFRFYCIAATILLAAIAVGAALGVTASKDTGSKAPTPAPSTYRESLGIIDQLISVVGEASLADPDSPHARAANWIINEDPRMLEPEADNLIQRFLLSLFYLATTERQPWLSCNPPVGDETYMCNYTKLAQVFPEVEYENVLWGRWLSWEHECGWAGVFCDEFNQTRAVELPGQQIRGTLPSEIALMPYLQSLTFNWNELYGTMPSELASMKHLLNIELHYNFFTGQVPAEWYAAQALQRVNFAGNFLSGSIPTEIGQLSTMKGFFSFENSIGGTIPSEIGKMKFLSFTRWGRNFMTGTMPSEVGNLEKLQEMWFHRNKFTGQLPSEMGNMRDMGDLRLHFNLFSGSIPEEHYEMPQLRRWDLYDCNMTGTISTAIGQMTNLQTFRIRENNFFGTLPTEMGHLSGLDSLWLHRNDLTGSVPIELCSLRGPAGINVLDADCGPTNGVGEPKIDCIMECCTACCDSETGYCIRENSGNS